MTTHEVYYFTGTGNSLAVAHTVTVLKVGRAVWMGAVEDADESVLRKAFLGG